MNNSIISALKQLINQINVKGIILKRKKEHMALEQQQGQ